ncbi:hypothetical protein G6F70_006942 [Rhizopus microsporus]|nr:hypothetical protein G6F71_006920 [Rhizopus microsporus]KAG1197050.1 hypothetical protein G6F70_006942 [Rhizopus microsporus]KAG1208854.1 hypothetical protein G6F69_006856 [Rhizopus microsporus]KAG1230244.1 hypothetical protein G6F67_006589 [Rhizopus microsporus]KAG1262359.1 hypothetical protein G6F68_005997 [Rhizopus microsporus]
MRFQIFYKGGHSNTVDEYGRPEPMDYIIHEERYALETVSSHTQYLHNQPQENNFDVGSMVDEDAKDDHKKTGRPRILHEEHKQVILEYIDENPSAVLKQVMERLLQRLQDPKV